MYLYVNSKIDIYPVMSEIFTQMAAKLRPEYTYHALAHTTMVLRDAAFIAEKMNIAEHDRNLLNIAICLHDFGLIVCYENHEEVGCDYAEELLSKHGFSPQDIAMICGMIMATKIPQAPKTELERIICDADLFYMGTPYYFEIANMYREELASLGTFLSDGEWKDIQVNFLVEHRYHTAVCRNLLECGKQRNLGFLRVPIKT